VAAATQLFHRLLSATQSRQQLQGLKALLQDVWREGDALPQRPPRAADSAPEQQEQEGDHHQQQEEGEEEEGRTAAGQQHHQQQRVSTMHSCWCSLFSAALQRDEADLVLTVFDHLAVAAGSSSPSQQQQQQKHTVVAPLSETELSELIAASEQTASAGLPVALTLGLLSPSAAHQHAAEERLRTSSLPAGNPYVAHLLCAVVYRGKVAALAAAAPPPPSQQQQQQQPHEHTQLAFSQLCALLMHTSPHPSTVPAIASAAPPRQRSRPSDTPESPAAGVTSDTLGALRSDEASVLLPHAVCQLISAGQLGTAAQLAATRLHFHLVLSFFGGAVMVLERYVGCIMHTEPAASAAPAGAWAGGSGQGRQQQQQSQVLSACCAALRSSMVAAAQQAYARLAAATR